MPIDSSVVDTTRSMRRNGTNRKKPIWKPVLSSEMANAGMTTFIGRSAGVDGRGTRPSDRNRARSASRVCLSMKSRSGGAPRVTFDVILRIANDNLPLGLGEPEPRAHD